MRETDDGDWELQSAHVKYTNDAETCEIDLIATVHVGEEEYYGNLERELMMDPTTGSKIACKLLGNIAGGYFLYVSNLFSSQLTR